MPTRSASNTAFLAVAAAVVLIAVAAVAFSLGRGTSSGTERPRAIEQAAAKPDTAIAPAARADADQPPKTDAEVAQPQAVDAPQSKRDSDEQASGPPDQTTYVIRGQTIYALDGSVAYRGDIDLRPTFERIATGERDRHRNDGSTFANREGRLPRKPRGYYTEWVVRTRGLREVGPQRLVTGKDGEAYYTPDHYETFIRVR